MSNRVRAKASSWVGLVDCQNFYVSCERAFAPRLLGRPVAVLSNNDGCVIARSEELKALGVAMGTPTHQIRHLIRRYRLALLSSNFTLYADMNRRFNDVLGRFSPQVEPYSIDESFIELAGASTQDLFEQGCQLASVIAQEVHLPVRVGIGQTRTLAKLANLLAKQQATTGTLVLDADSDLCRKSLEQTAVGDVWGVGKHLAERLQGMGINTAWQLREAPEPLIRRRFSLPVQRIQWELKGFVCREGKAESKQRKSLRVTRSFGSACSNFDEVLDAVRTHVQRVAEKLREQQSLATTLSVYLRTNPYRSDLPQHSDSLVYHFMQPTSDTSEMLAVARKLLKRMWRPGFAYQKAGVLLLDLVDVATEIPSLLDNQESRRLRAKRERMMQLMDQINREQGSGSLMLGMNRSGTAWKAKQEKRSPAYTTCWQDLPQVVAR